MGWLRFVFIVALCSNASAKSFDAGTSEPIFETEYGIMVGMTVNDSDVFLGVPFVKPPVGELRFKDLVKLEKFTEEQKTKTNRPNCMQSDREGSPTVRNSLPVKCEQNLKIV
ncbi:Lipase 1 [Holothuria leucospilota]|uniref:Lipase 1 n=1 Tax=Holothuria leucospilota TaxID=206669 RepID=A0A9Q1CKI0_HOLLE|nr:Lipase 1 [Holothuria leucospilota]